MKVKILLVGLLGVLVTGYGFSRISTKHLNFEDIKEGQIVEGTDYIYDFQEVEISSQNGTPFKTTGIYLVDQKRGTRFRIPGNFSFSRNLKEVTCSNCIDVIYLHEKIYFVTSRHAGGSGDYYLHSVVEIADAQAVEKERYLSCSNVYIRNNQITFPRHKIQCPELFPNINWNAWEYRSFDLSEH